MYLIVGLGNPDPKFDNTPHNAGFNVVNTLAKEQDIQWKKVKIVQGEAARGLFCEKKVILFKPLTYMNKSGLALRNALQFWKIGLDQVLVVQDDSDIKQGRIKLVYGQSSGGHKGIESIIKALGNQKFARLKIGVRPAHLPQGGKNHTKAERFILGNFSKSQLEKVFLVSKEATIAWLTGGLEKAMNEFNRKIDE